MEIKYVNHNDETINLTCDKYVIEPAGIFDYEWQYQSTNTNLGGRVTRFYRQVLEKSVTVYVTGKTRREWSRNLKTFFDIIEADVLEKTPGRLILDTGEYMSCYLIASTKTIGYGVFTMICGMKIVTEKPFWCRDIEFHFSPFSTATSQQGAPFLDYPYDYPYDYLRGSNIQTIKNDFIAGTQGNDFEMTIYGYVDQPVVTIGAHPYKVHVAVYPTESVVINSRDKTIKKYKPNGEIVNIYNLRDKENSVFAKVAPGVSIVSSNAEFDLTLFQERSEPLWNL